MKVYLKTLREVSSACEERVRYYRGDGWIRTTHLCGTKLERSSRRLLDLMRAGLIEGKKNGQNNQGQYHWRMTDAGRAFEILMKDHDPVNHETYEETPVDYDPIM
jgi:predicted DNA-binding ArsR family transcriptional regulator